MSDFSYSIRDRTSSSGFVPGMQPMFDAMRQAAADAGLARLEMVAGKGQGHLSHAHGTEADIVGYNADGSKWSKAQRVAVARGGATAGANRFGFYSGPTLHVGLGYAGSPHNVVWNNKLRGVPGVTTFAPEERDFVNALRAGKLASYTASAGGPASSGNPQVAALQQQLNAQGANIAVDGIMGPQTRAAQARYGSTTAPVASAYAATAATTPAQQAIAAATAPRAPQARPPITSNWSSLQNPYTNSTGGANAISVPTSSVKASPFPGVQLPSYDRNITYPNAVQVGARAVPTKAVPYSPSMAPVGATPGALNRPAIQTPYLNQPYTTSLGGANAIVQPAQTARIPQARPVPSTPVKTRSEVADVQSQLNSRGAHLKVDGIVGPLTMAAAREFGDVPAATRLQWSGLQSPFPTARIPQARPASPYINSTGGTNALTARMPQPRPAYPPPSVAPAGPTLMQQMQDQMRRAAAVAAQVGGQFRDAYSQGSRSGMGYQGGGGYTGGSYGGSAGRSINTGVGGAFRNR
jgi:hypothetical protein